MNKKRTLILIFILGVVFFIDSFVFATDNLQNNIQIKYDL